LPPLHVSAEMVAAVRARLPELPNARRSRFSEDYALAAADSALLTLERDVADVYAEVAAGGDRERARQAANWIVNDVMGLQKARGLPADRLPLSAPQLRDLLDLVGSGAVTARAAKELLPELGDGELPRDAAARLNLLALDNEDEVRQAAIATIAAFPAAVADFRGGKQAAIGRLIGETIRRTGGRAKPDQVRVLLIEELGRE
ncbi:MAG: Asp-tRNA(Asn)/Glu-tRNA(Gln) amidotransferase GatCAB subunit B, partial [Chloroflexota bacterium]